MSSNPHIIEVSDNYIHLKSDVAPSWIKNLEEFKLMIRAEIDKGNRNEETLIKFSHPIDVPSSQVK